MGSEEKGEVERSFGNNFVFELETFRRRKLRDIGVVDYHGRYVACVKTFFLVRD